MQAGILWAHIGLSNDMRVPGLQKILGEQLEKYPKRMESAREFPALIEAGTEFPMPSATLRHLTPHLGGVLVGVEADQEMENPLREPHDALDAGRAERRLVHRVLVGQ